MKKSITYDCEVLGNLTKKGIPDREPHSFGSNPQKY
jgi:hypothetical protein